MLEEIVQSEKEEQWWKSKENVSVLFGGSFFCRKRSSRKIFVKKTFHGKKNLMVNDE
jgi:hypothetical protein